MADHELTGDVTNVFVFFFFFFFFFFFCYCLTARDKHTLTNPHFSQRSSGIRCDDATPVYTMEVRSTVAINVDISVVFFTIILCSFPP